MKYFTARDSEAVEFVAKAIAHHFDERDNWLSYEKAAREHIVAFAAYQEINNGKVLQPKREPGAIRRMFGEVS